MGTDVTFLAIGACLRYLLWTYFGHTLDKKYAAGIARYALVIDRERVAVSR